MRIASWNVNSVRTRLEQVLAWLEQGGVYAIAHVRGGGELGQGEVKEA